MLVVAEVDRGPLSCGAFTEHVREGDGPENDNRGASKREAKARPALRFSGDGRLLGKHPRRQHADDQERGCGQNEHLVAQRESDRNTNGAESRAGKGPQAPRAVETGHEG